MNPFMRSLSLGYSILNSCKVLINNCLTFFNKLLIRMRQKINSFVANFGQKRQEQIRILPMARSSIKRLDGVISLTEM